MELIYNEKQHPVNLQGIYKGASCFYIGAGPSLNQIENPTLVQLSQTRGITTFAVNNIAARNVRPNIWCCIDSPKSFHRNIWDDPSILKFTKTENWDHGYNGGMVNNAPNLFWFRINGDFNTETFFKESTISCGRYSHHTDNLGISGGRSVMLVAIRLMHYLGFKRVYLLGCDFNMQPEQPYAFEQTKWPGGVKTNNQMYSITEARLKSLIPQMDRDGFQVYNCTPNSKLSIFPEMKLEQAVKLATCSMIKEPNLKAMYG